MNDDFNKNKNKKFPNVHKAIITQTIKNGDPIILDRKFDLTKPIAKKEFKGFICFIQERFYFHDPEIEEKITGVFYK